MSRAAGGGGSSTARSPLVHSTTCLGLHLVTGSMVSKRLHCLGWDVSGGVLQPVPAVVPCAPWASAQACMAAVSGPSRCDSARGARSWAPAHGAAVSGVGLLLQLPPSSCSPRTPLRDTAPHGCDLRLQAGGTVRAGGLFPGRELGARLALRGSCERRPSPRRGPHSSCAGAWSLPASRSHLLRHRRRPPGRGRTRSVRARVAKFQLSAELRE